MKDIEKEIIEDLMNGVSIEELARYYQISQDQIKFIINKYIGG